MNIGRLKTLRKALAKKDLESLLVTDILNVRYLTSFTGSFGIVIATQNEAVFITDSRYTDQASEETEGFSLELLKDGTNETIARIAKKLRIRQLGIEEHSVTYGEWIKLCDALPDAEIVTAGNPISLQRMIKDSGEIKNIRKAAQITDAGCEHIIPLVKPGVTERELAIELESFMKSKGAEKESFDSIIASGPRSALVHGRASDRMIKPGDLVLFDFGARYNGYHADISRTIAVGKPTARQQKIYDIVLEAQKRAIDAVKPGVTGGAIDEIARDYIKSRGYEKKFGHGLGHGIGLDIHDDKVLSRKSETLLKPGMVFTVEPGIYITGWGGIRIEDDVLVTKTGCEVITKSTKTLRLEK